MDFGTKPVISPFRLLGRPAFECTSWWCVCVRARVCWGLKFQCLSVLEAPPSHALGICQNVIGHCRGAPGGRSENTPGETLPKGPWKNRDKLVSSKHRMEGNLPSNQSRALLGLNPCYVNFIKFSSASVDIWETIPEQLALENQARNASYKINHVVNKLLNSY